MKSNIFDVHYFCLAFVALHNFNALAFSGVTPMYSVDTLRFGAVIKLCCTDKLIFILVFQ